jgi:hypothetical protein
MIPLMEIFGLIRILASLKIVYTHDMGLGALTTVNKGKQMP